MFRREVPWSEVLLRICILITGMMAGSILEVGPRKTFGAGMEVDNAVVFLADMSSSLNTDEQAIVRAGHAYAIASPEVVSAIMAGPRQRSAFVYIEFADNAVVVADWTIIDSQHAANQFAAAIMDDGADRASGTSTAVGAGMAMAHEALLRSPFKADFTTVDVVGDGRNNVGIDPAAPRLLLLDMGATINGLPVTLSPDPGVVEYYQSQIIGGLRAFLIEIQSVNDLPMAIRRKILLEIG